MHSLLRTDEKEEARALYIKDFDIVNVKEGIVLHAVYDTATSRNNEYDKRHITPQELIPEQVKDL